MEAVWSEGLPTWVQCHVNALRFFGGATELWVPDNLKSGVTKPDRYEPELNPTYANLAEYYGVAVIPARVRKPKDKAKVKVGVLLAQRWIIAALRKRTFFARRRRPVGTPRTPRTSPPRSRSPRRRR